MRRLRGLPLLALLAAAPPPVIRPPVPYGPPSPYDLCELAVAGAGNRSIPATLLPAIARVESGRIDLSAGRVRPWPWAINAAGVGSFFDSKDEAVAAVRALQERGIRSIDVGCMQVNLFHHPTAFTSLEAGFDPAINTAYAVRFLTGLYGQTHDWALATAMYHSQTQTMGEDYQRRVFGRVMTPMGPAASTHPIGPYAPWPPPGVAFGALPPPSYAFGAFAPPPGRTGR